MSFQFTVDHEITDALFEESAVSWGGGVKVIWFRFCTRRAVARFSSILPVCSLPDVKSVLVFFAPFQNLYTAIS